MAESELGPRWEITALDRTRQGRLNLQPGADTRAKPGAPDRSGWLAARQPGTSISLASPAARSSRQPDRDW